MKHLLYVLYVSLYAAAVFLAGLFAGQWLERKNTQKEFDKDQSTGR
ncbi:MAG: hypothetical protein HY200_08330 [Nitrospirae bacterium]|nr:hypothetical protein [Nitrospirota bacterium]MBI3594950.1 hypothetical protein [Nitrospirota bacterium]